VMATKAFLMVECLYITHVFGPWAHIFKFLSDTPFTKREWELGRTKTR